MLHNKKIMGIRLTINNTVQATVVYLKYTLQILHDFIVIKDYQGNYLPHYSLCDPFVILAA